ncbi:MAG: peptidylprolyl isomerase [Rhodothermaceae bacterium]|nr:peptidylprolyl isomerase [Rhodothermaceae bacterium]
MTSSKPSLSLFAPLLLLLLIISGCNANQASSQTEPDAQLFSSDDFAGSHILVAYSGAMRADSAVTRSKEEAFAKAEGLIAQLNEAPETFEELARTESDGPSGVEGGDLGSWPKGQMVAEFDAAIETLELNGITSEPVETAFGYHVIRRNAVEKIPHYNADLFIIGFAGPRTPPTITRDIEGARALADSLKDVINASNFEEMAAMHNDAGEGEATPVGVFPETAQLPISGLADTLSTVGFGEVVGPLAFQGGFAFVRRLEVSDQRAGAHILISYAGARNAADDITRTKEEALEEAMRITALAKEDPTNFAELAKEHSNGPSGPGGGDLGKWFKGRMVPAFDDALDTMDPGDITDEPVETEFGYHIIIRNEIGG